MKRILCLTLALLMTLSALLCLPACSGQNKLPADFVKGDEIVIDNETPFVYSEKTRRSIRKNVWGVKREYGIMDFADFCCGTSDTPQETYAFFAGYFGNKPIRELVTEEETVYYTVYSLSRYTLLYLFLEKKGDDYLCDQVYAADGREDDMLRGMVLDKDLPTAILGDKLPPECYLDYYPPEEIERRNNLEWEFYGEYCSSAGIPTDPFTSDFYCDLYAQGRHKEVDGAIRCIQSVSFDAEEGDPEDEDYRIHHGAYFYDIYVFTDGTGILFFTHFNTDVHPRYAVWQKEEIKLSVIEVQKLTTLLDVWDFNNIPTWNPAELSGFDGESTTVYTKISGHHNLTSMWSASERDAVYHIREAIEEIVRDHVTVERGRIYNLAWYEK
ncbi:MAG: hypothetical protein J6M42_00715 [Clostridia bacterium]|nr:hypothetical protein [Clostridia bacterium]